MRGKDEGVEVPVVIFGSCEWSCYGAAMGGVHVPAVGRDWRKQLACEQEHL